MLIPIGFFGSSLPAWAAIFGGGIGEGYAVKEATSGSIYSGIRNNIDSITPIGIFKQDSAGAMLWARSLRTSYSPDNLLGDLALDSSENVYISGQLLESGATRAFLAKYNSSGTLQWQFRFGPDSGINKTGQIFVDSSSNVFATGIYAASGNSFITKLDSAGTVIWRTQLALVNMRSVTVDSSGNVYGVGYESNTRVAIVKLDSAGTVIWQRRAPTSVTIERSFADIAVDSSGNVYATHVTQSSNFVQLLKLDSTGALVWVRRLSTDMGSGCDLAIDSAGNVVISSRDSFVKFDSSGAPLLQRTITHSSTFAGSGRFSLTENYLTTMGAVGSDNGVVKMLADGSNLGTFSPWTIAAGSITVSSPLVTVLTGTYTVSSPTIVKATATATQTTPTYTSTVTKL